MSGAGKSHWSQKLTASGFRAISVDDRIEEKLSSELNAGGYRGIGGVAEWMGWPDQPAYREREQKYLAREIEVMNEALDKIENAGEEDIVLDTTGSVVYTGDDICGRLRQLTTVVYLAVSQAEEVTLIERYLSNPKPVLWAGEFSQLAGESAKDAVARCYPQLIARRKHLYERYADRIVPMKRLRDPELSARDFLQLVSSSDNQARDNQVRDNKVRPSR